MQPNDVNAPISAQICRYLQVYIHHSHTLLCDMAAGTECTCTYSPLHTQLPHDAHVVYQNSCLHWLCAVHSVYQEEACYPLMVWATVLGEVAQPLLKETCDYLYSSVHDDGGEGGQTRPTPDNSPPPSSDCQHLS